MGTGIAANSEVARHGTDGSNRSTEDDEESGEHF